MTASAGVSPENVVETAKVMLEEFHKLVDDPVSEEELTKARDYSVGSFRLGLEDTMSVARWVGDSLTTIGEIQDVEDVVARLRSTTPDDLQRVAKRLFVDNPISAALTGPQDETNRLREVIRA